MLPFESKAITKLWCGICSLSKNTRDPYAKWGMLCSFEWDRRSVKQEIVCGAMVVMVSSYSQQIQVYNKYIQRERVRTQRKKTTIPERNVAFGL